MKNLLLIIIFTFAFSASTPLAAALASNVPVKIVQPKFTDFTVSVNGQDIRVNISGQVSDQVTIEIYSITGQRISNQVIQKQEGRTYDISLESPLRKGLYIIKVSSGSQVLAKKLNIQ